MSLPADSLRETILELPKVELHVHFEGSIQPASLLWLAKKNQVELPASTEEALKEWFTFRDFPHFAEVYTTASSCIRNAEDLEFLAEQFAQERERQNILYSEVTYTATTILKHSGIPFQEQLEALNRGVAKVPGVVIRWVIDIVREFTPEQGEEVAQWCIDYRDKGVAAIGLSGFELKYPLSRHAHAFATARLAGVPITAHAGETQGPEAIYEALDVIESNRIGHGVRCLEDGRLVARLRDNMIHLEVNPSSNVCLAIFPNLEAHPIGRMIDEGLSVSINSDDPPMFNTSLTEEWARCVETFELPLDILYTLNANAVNASFLSSEEKQDLRQKMVRGFNEVLND